MRNYLFLIEIKFSYYYVTSNLIAVKAETITYKNIAI